VAKRRKLKSRARYAKKSSSIGKGTLSIIFAVGILSILLIFSGSFRNNVFTTLTQVLAVKPGGGGGYDSMAGCAGKTTRPCYDKLTTSGVNILGKNGENTFTSCTSNAASNKVGEFIHKTTVCGQEKVTYCHDGASSNFIRKFSGQCATEPPPPPPPSPEPTPTPGPVSSNPFRITYPNGGEQLPFGSHQVVRWEGGDTTSEWPIYLSISDRDRNVAIREMVIGTANDGQEDWIVDLPLGNYYVYYGQGCRLATCTSASQWDQSDNKFSVVAGSPVEKVNSSYSLNQSLVVLSPSGAEAWTVGSTQTIKWSGGNSSWRVRVYLIDVVNSTTYSALFADLENDGSEIWTVPAYIPSGQYKIYVGCNNCAAAPSGFTGGFYTYSFYPFTIKTQ